MDMKLGKLGRRSRRKGEYERKVKWFEDKLGITLERTPQSGGFAKNRNLSKVKATTRLTITWNCRISSAKTRKIGA